MKTLTRKGFIAWLESNPGKLAECGNAEACVLAHYISDDLLQPEKGEEAVEVSHNGITTGKVESNDPVWGLQLDFRSRKEHRLPQWARRVVQAFDDIDPEMNGKRVRNSTTLRRLREAGVL